MKLCRCGCGKEVEERRTYIKFHAPGSIERSNRQKGKTIEEIFGIEQAKIIKQKLSITHKGVSKTEEFKQNNSNLFKGKSYEERLGVVRANEIKNKLKESFKNSIKRQRLKGLSLEEKVGVEKANKIKLAVSKAHKGQIVSIETRKLLSIKKTIPEENIIKEFKEKWQLYNGFAKKYFDRIMSCNRQTIVNKFGSMDEFANLCGVEFKSIDTKVFGHNGRIGKYEKEVLDRIEKEKNIKLERQFYIAGKFVDGYDVINNIVIEYDEKHHRLQQVEDFLREQKIKNILGCKFIRIKENEFLNRIQNKILENFIEVR